MTQPLTTQLKERTAQSHRALERSFNIMRADLDRAGYVESLRALYAFLRPWEQRIRAYVPPAVLAPFEPALHLRRLAADLTALTKETPVAHAEAVDYLPAIDSEAAALGSLYVIQGSMLGARIIGPHIARTLGLSAEHGCAYFSGGASCGSAQWAAFQAMLCDRIAPVHHEHAIQSAIETFEGLRRWLATSEAFA